MQLGFVIDHSRCIGCHACTVACKSENNVPLGSFRTWVKYTEKGSFPAVKRSFAVLRCNQCTQPPCVDICPVRALEKRPDGIIDVDPDRCIGCKSCLQGCPYDALYINEDSGTAEKCHFCAHRTEVGLAPACAVVCPTEAIIPGDVHDPGGVLGQLREEYDLQVRKPEAETGPNVFYREVDSAGISPQETSGATGYHWAERQGGSPLRAELFEALEDRAEARTVYDVDHAPAWGWKVSAYLFTKSISGGAWLVFLPFFLGWMSLGTVDSRLFSLMAASLGLLFLGLTTVLLVADLRRPSRFLYVVFKANWTSWLSRGALALMGYGGLLTAVMALGFLKQSLPTGLALVTGFAGAMCAMYTAWLFGQAKGRVFWLRRGLAAHLFAQAMVAGAASCLVVVSVSGWDSVLMVGLARLLQGSLGIHLVLTLFEARMAPRGREAEYARVARLVSHGPYARRHWGVGILLGGILPGVVLCLSVTPLIGVVAGLAALVGLASEEDVLVRAGQALPIS
ncbi:MAG: polysulfide reductase NrfD [Planctomycetota bacterium]|jgi:Fe-S-cluster-containing dehydrogenase component/formate-dependent nitrite reductase membrane component NrfD|nr:polysulfide reductase NrfD [Planctomycetota bacterium]